MPAGCYSPFYQRVGEQLGLVVPFTEGESCSSCLSAVDYSCNHIGAIGLGADSASWLTSVAGVLLSGSGEDNRLTSSFSMEAVMATANGLVDGCSVELWLLSSSLADDNVVMTVGSVPIAGSYNPEYTQIAAGDSLLLVQVGAIYQFIAQLDPEETADSFVVSGDIPTVTNRFPYRPTTHSFHPLQSSTPTLTQLVLVLNATGNTTSLYINGELAQQLTRPFLSPITSWFTSSSFISFAQTTSSSSSPTWAGQIRLLAFYTSALTLTQVRTNWNASLPPTVPQPPPVTAVTWTQAQPTFTVNFTSTIAKVWVTVVGLPSVGTLTWLNGSVLTNISTVPLWLDGSAPIVFTYTAPVGVNASFVANITYTLTSPSAPSLVSNPGVLTFRGGLAIIPPVGFSLFVNATAQVPLLVQLAGEDEDTTAPTLPVTSALIATLPSYGTLYQCSSNATLGAALTLSAASTYGTTNLLLIRLTDPSLRLWYIPSPASLTYSKRTVVTPLDTFTFRVEVKGALSSVALVQVMVLNNLQAEGMDVVLVSGNATQVALVGWDAAQEVFAFTVLSLPSHGALLDGHNVSVVALAPLTLPLWYITAQDRWSGAYDRRLAPVPDSFTFAVNSASGLLSPPATVSLTFAPTPGPPVLQVTPPFDATLLTASLPANFSLFINTSGLADPDNTSWACTLSVSPATGSLAWLTPLPSVFLALSSPQVLTFQALTTDANALLSNLSFTGAEVGSYTVDVVVANAGDTRIAATTSLVLEVTTGQGQGGVGGDSAASFLPFNALYLWVTVSVLVALIIAALLLRRYGRKRGPVLTHEERHILAKAGGGGRLDGGVLRAKGVGTSSSSAGTELGLGGGVQVSPVSGQQRGKEGGEEEDVLKSLTAVCLANVNLAEKSFLGSRMDSEAWGNFGEAQQQQRSRGLQLVPTTSVPVPFDLYATGNIDRYEGTDGGAGLSQTLSASGGASQLVVLPGDSAEEKSATRTRPARLLLHTDSFDRTLSISPASPAVVDSALAPPAHVNATTFHLKMPLSAVTVSNRTRLAPLSVAGLLASPRFAASTSSAFVSDLGLTPLRDQIVPTGGFTRRKLEMQSDEAVSVLPQVLTSPRARSPAHSDRTSVLCRPSFLQLSPHSHSHQSSLSTDLVPVNPMVPVNLDSPRYPLEVFNRVTGEREKFTPSSGQHRTPNGVDAGLEKRAEDGMGDRASELERLAGEVMRSHPLFRTTTLVTSEEEEEEKEAN